MNVDHKMLRSALYVGFSRATTLDGLFIVGTFKAPAPPGPSSKVVVEIDRLRKEPLIPKYSFLKDVPFNEIQIVSHNIRSLRKHVDNVKADAAFLNSDILCFQELWARPNDQFHIPGFIEVCRHDEENKQGPRVADGCAIFVNENLKDLDQIFKDKKSFTSHDSKEKLDISIMKWNKFWIINIYKGPNTSLLFFKNIMNDMFEDILNDSNVILLGDFNESLKHESNLLESFLGNKYNFHLISQRTPTTDRGSIIDGIFVKTTSDITFKTYTYESLISDHRPLFLRLSNGSQSKFNPEYDSKIKEDQKKADESKKVEIISKSPIQVDEVAQHLKTIKRPKKDTSLKVFKYKDEAIKVPESAKSKIDNCVVFSNTLNYNDEKGQSLFVMNLCPYNSIAHGMLFLMKTKSNIPELMTHPYFNQLRTIASIKNHSERNYEWVSFIKKAAGKFWKPQNNAVNMEGDIADVIYELLKDPNLTFCKVEYSCSKPIKEICNRITFSSFVNIELIVGDTLDNLKELINIALQKNCRGCQKSAEMKVAFQNIIFLSINRSSNNQMYLSDIPSSLDYNNEFYEFKFLIHLQSHHFTSFCRSNENQVWLLDDLTGSQKLIDQIGNKIPVNPVLLVYFLSSLSTDNDDKKAKVQELPKSITKPLSQKIPKTLSENENIVSKKIQKNTTKNNMYVIFPNTIKYVVNSKTGKSIEVINLCPYNSLIHGMIFAVKNDRNVRDFVFKSAHPFFKNLVKLIALDKSEFERNQLWITHIKGKVVNKFKKLQNDVVNLEADMADAVNEMFYYKLHPLCKVEFRCCNPTKRKCSTTIAYSEYVNIEVSIQKDDLKNIKDVIFQSFRSVSCKSCAKETKVNVSLYNFTFISINRKDINTVEKITVEDFPSSFEHDGRKFSFKFLIHFENHHFICYSKEGKNNFWKLDDVRMKDDYMFSNAANVNPVLAVYFSPDT